MKKHCQLSIVNCQLFICLLLFALLPVGCKQKPAEKKIISVTIEPQRYWAERLAGSLFTIETMVPAGTSPETYDPSPQQVANIVNSRGYLALGHLGFELHWLHKLKENSPNTWFFYTCRDVNLIETRYAHGDHHHEGADPHVWSSPKQTLILIRNMYDALVTLDEVNRDVYTLNYEKLRAEVEAVDRTVSELAEQVEVKDFLIYHPTLSYLARDYGLHQHAIEQEGKEPSAQQVKELIDLAREKNIQVVFIQEEFDKKNAELIAQETQCRLVVINPLSYDWGDEIIRTMKALVNE